MLSIFLKHPNVLNNTSNFDPGRNKDAACSDADYWFNDSSNQKLNRKNNKDSLASKENEEIQRLHEELRIVNEKKPQRNIDKFGNQLLYLEPLHCYHE